MNRNIINYRYCAVLFFFVSCLFFLGCKCGSNSGSSSTITNPFAIDRQTVPPPATFSSQQALLGQIGQPGSFTPQTPAATYPATTPISSPVNSPIQTPIQTVPSGSITPLPSTQTITQPVITQPNTQPTGFSSGANFVPDSVYQQVSYLEPAQQKSIEEKLGEEVGNFYTGETAFQNIETKSQSLIKSTENGTISGSLDSMTASTSQWVTKIVDEPQNP